MTLFWLISGVLVYMVCTYVDNADDISNHGLYRQWVEKQLAQIRADQDAPSQLDLPLP